MGSGPNRWEGWTAFHLILHGPLTFSTKIAGIEFEMKRKVSTLPFEWTGERARLMLS